MNGPVRADFIPYPLWRRRGMPPIHAFWSAVSASDADNHPPLSADYQAHYLARWRILPAGMNAADARRALIAMPDVTVTPAPDAPLFTPQPAPLRLPAQWEPTEAITLAFPVLYPPLWTTHLQMIAAIAPVARVDVLLPHPVWARLIRLHLDTIEGIDTARVRFVHLPTDDIWVRDYGAIVGCAPDGSRAAISAIYDPLQDTYPQSRDAAAAARYAGLLGLPAHRLDLHTEGGNIWSDGAGTLLMSDDLYSRHPDLAREQVEARLRAAIACDVLITTPPLRHEETGHIDLAIKLADARTILIADETPFNRDRLRQTRTILSGARNAAGEPYRLVTLPMPTPYLNWGVFPVWRSYTNALTVNGRVLVPTFGIQSDAAALDIYRRVMPDHAILPIDCAASANGGGAVHCLTKEVPGA